jgi:hypothetical protein
MSKVFFHIGAHKTGSSFLQVNFSANAASLAKQNWKVVLLRNDFRRAHNQILRLREGKKVKRKRMVLVDNFFKEMCNESANTLISSEGFLGHMSVLKAGGTLYPHHAAMLTRIRNGLADRDVTIGYCIRDFGSLLESSYSQLVLGGATYGFDEYVSTASADKLSWIGIIEQMVAIFGVEHVRLWAFEDFKNDADAAFKAIAKSASIDPNTLIPRPEARKNASFPPHTIPVAIAWNKLLEEHLREIGKGEKHDLRRKMRALLSQVGTPDVKSSLMDSESRAQFTAQYARELAAIRERWPSVIVRFGSAPSVFDQ